VHWDNLLHHHHLLGIIQFGFSRHNGDALRVPTSNGGDNFSTVLVISIWCSPLILLEETRPTMQITIYLPLVSQLIKAFI